MFCICLGHLPHLEDTWGVPLCTFSGRQSSPLRFPTEPVFFLLWGGSSVFLLGKVLRMHPGTCYGHSPDTLCTPANSSNEDPLRLPASTQRTRCGCTRRPFPIDTPTYAGGGPYLPVLQTNGHLLLVFLGTVASTSGKSSWVPLSKVSETTYGLHESVCGYQSWLALRIVRNGLQVNLAGTKGKVKEGEGRGWIEGWLIFLVFPLALWGLLHPSGEAEGVRLICDSSVSLQDGKPH